MLNYEGLQTQYLKIKENNNNNAKIKLLVVFIISLLFSLSANGTLIEIKVKVQGEVITNLDIENEINYLTFLNPKLRNLEKKKRS